MRKKATFGIILLFIVSLSLFSLKETEPSENGGNGFHRTAEPTGQKEAPSDRGVLRVGMRTERPPYSYLVNGRASGISVDYMNRLGRRGGRRIAFIARDSRDELCRMLQDGTLDILLDCYPSMEGTEHFLFTPPYVSTRRVLVTSAESTESSVEKLSDKVVALEEDSIMKRVWRRDHSDIRQYPVQTLAGGLKALSYGRVDAVFGEELILRYLYEQTGDSGFKFSGETIYGSSIHMAVRADDEELREMLKELITSEGILYHGGVGSPDFSAQGTEEREEPGNLVTNPLFIYSAFLFIAIVFFMMISVQKFHRKQLESGVSYDQKKFLLKSLSVVGCSLIIIFLFIIIGLVSMKRSKMRETMDALESASYSTMIILNQYIQQNLGQVMEASGDGELVEMTLRVLEAERKDGDLRSATELEDLKSYLDKHHPNISSSGYLIISPDQRIIASDRDEYIGEHNHILSFRPVLMEKAMEGTAMYIPPLPEEGRSAYGRNGNAGMYYSAPLKDGNDRVVAVLARREDPEENFTAFCQLGRVGRTGETYAFDSEARMLSSSLFEPELRSIGLLGRYQPSALNIRITDPGKKLSRQKGPEEEPEDQQHTVMVREAVFNGDGRSAEGYRDYRGEEVWGSWHWSDSLNMGVASEIRVRDALATFYIARRFCLLVFLVVSGLAVKSTIFSLRIGRRANDMLLNINSRLESRVERRTRDLSEANRNLKDTITELDRARTEAEAADRAKSDFMANVSHEFRTPMNGIIGLAHLMGKTELSDEQKDYLDKITRSTGRLLGLVEDILDFSEAERGLITLKRSRFEPQALFRNLQNLMEEQAAAKGLEIRFSLTGEVPGALLGDARRLSQVLQHLVENAVKFTESGCIDVLADCPDRSEKRATLKFLVRDTGIGLTGEQKTDLFKSFFQGDSSVTRKYGGTGLGLSICQSLVSLMGGKIEVESEYGKGSLFHFTLGFDLPSGILHQESSETEALSLDRIRGGRILVVEDNEINQQVIRELLEGDGFVVDLASNGAEGVERAVESGAYDAVLMDLQMPVMGGYDAALAIRDTYSPGELPIIALTADAMVGARERVLESGMQDYLAKPIDVNELWRILAKWIAPGDRELPETYVRLKESENTPVEGEFPSIPGLDIDEGLNRIGGRRELYLNMLRQFCADYPGAEKDIRNALAEDRRSDAVRHAHTVKGLAGSLGALDLYRSALALETGLKAGESGGTTLERFAGDLDVLIRNIRESGLLEAEEEKRELSEVDGSTVITHVRRAVESLKARKPRPAAEILETMEGYVLKEDAKIAFTEARKLLKKYRMNDAADVLESIVRIYEKEEPN